MRIGSGVGSDAVEVARREVRGMGMLSSGDADDFGTDMSGFKGRAVNREEAQDLYTMFTKDERRRA